MKYILPITFLISLTSQAAVVNSAKLDASKENILIDVTYSGGCHKHTFALDLNPSCKETFPVQCSAALVEVIEGGFDPCEAIITTTAVINLKELNLDDSYYSGAYLTISGDVGPRGKRTSAAVTLPR